MITTEQLTAREERGRTIASLCGQVKIIEDSVFKVKSQAGKGVYEVLKTSIGWMCSCPDHVYRHVKCKHIYAVEFSLALKQNVAKTRIEPINNVSDSVTAKAAPSKPKPFNSSTKVRTARRSALTITKQLPAT